PLRKITAAAERMAQGDLSQMVQVRSSNEIGFLARRFNYMASELRRRNSELEEERNKLVAVLTNMAGGALLIDPQGQIVIKNRSAMQLLGAQEVNPDEEKLAPLMGIIDNAVRSKASGSEELPLPYGRVAHVMWTALHSEEQELIGFVMVMNDITELRRIDEMRREFVTNVSHELRTPLASLKGLAEILLDGALKEEEGKRFLRSINREIDRLTRLVKDLLDLSKIESGLVKFEVREVDLHALVEDILQRMERRFDTFRLRSELAPSRVLADSDRVEQVVINLLDNAIRHTPPGEEIRIQITSDGEHQQVTVENVGSGIPSGELSRIFERFYRIDKHRSRDLGGTGLGLSISRHIVERLGGRIWAESNGRETRFIFTLPTAPAEVTTT
ncbi:MAG: ATP-binding protein, partial [Candidatus Xenobia bacterium]